MNWTRNAAMAALLVGMATPAAAQQGFGGPRFEGRGPGGGVEAVLRQRESLKLSEAQVNQLESLRKEIVAQRQNEARDMIDLQSRIAAGQVEREEARKQMESRREELRNTMEQRRERLEKILTDAQREQLRSQLRENFRDRRGDMRRPRGRGDDGPPIRGRYRWN